MASQLIQLVAASVYHGNYTFPFMAAWAKAFGTPLQQESLGLLRRAEYAYGLVRAAEMATLCGKTACTVCEFGVADGDGLANLAELAEILSPSLGIQYRIFGFDTGAGLPAPRDMRDHPETWQPGQFKIIDRLQVEDRVRGRAVVIWGDINETVPDFTASLDQEAPLAFVSLDVDLYSAAKGALRVFEGKPSMYGPGVCLYADDVSFWLANSWCGELAAIEDFNNAHSDRKIDVDRVLPGIRRLPHLSWYRRMFVAHILDHPHRKPNPADAGQSPVT